MTTAELVAIKNRCAKASPAPWVTDYRESHVSGRPMIVLHAGGQSGSKHDWPWLADINPDNVWDGLLIAHARDDLPALIAEVERLRSELAVVAEACESFANIAKWTSDPRVRGEASRMLKRLGGQSA